MTAYFDQWDEKLSSHRRSFCALHDSLYGGTMFDPPNAVEAQKTANSIHEMVREHEERLVYDVTVAAESPGMPCEIRERIHKTVLAHAVESRPVNDATNPRVVTAGDHFDELHRLSFELHSIFHDLCLMNSARFSDDPRAPMRALYVSGEEYRERLVEARKKAAESTVVDEKKEG